MVDLKDAALQIVVEALDVIAVIFAAELEGLVAVYQGEVVEGLEGFTDAAAGNAVSACAEILDDTVKVDFRQTQLAVAEIESIAKGCRIELVDGTEAGAKARVTEVVSRLAETT